MPKRKKKIRQPEIRIKELRTVRVGDLISNPKNWRTHPEAQRRALGAAIDRVGFADAPKVFETDAGLMLIDGHARAEELDPDAEIPVQVLDVSEDEADFLIATYDPLSAMAYAGVEATANLLRTVDLSGDFAAIANQMKRLSDESLRALLAQDPDAWKPEDEWAGMPAFSQDNLMAWKSIAVHFVDLDALRAFAALINQPMTDKTKFVWYPQNKVEHVKDLEYQGDSPRSQSSENDDDETSEDAPHGEVEIEVNGVRSLIRPDTADEYIVREIVRGKGEYHKINMQEGDIVADIGMNIGMASIYFMRQGALMVHGYEPDEDNFRLIEHNLILNAVDDTITPHRFAVVGNDDPEREFSINVKRNKGAHSLVKKRGRDTVVVPAINIHKILADVSPTIVKMDIEGGEVEVLRAVDDWGGVRELIMEFHHDHLGDIRTGHPLYIEALDKLRSQFDEVDAKHPDDLGGAWTGIIYCRNNQ